MSKRRPYRTGLDRLITTLRKLSKYSLSGALVALAGCVPSPNLVGVSPDGRYIVLPVNQLGVVVAPNDASSIIRMDLKTNDVQVIGPNQKGVFWMSIAGDAIAHCADGGDGLSIVLHHGLEAPVTIKNAMLPTLSPDGASMVYVAADQQNQRTASGKLMKRDVKTGKTTDLKLEGTAPEFSPDGKRLLYVAITNTGGALHVTDADGGNSKKISDIVTDLPEIFRPRWAGADAVLYRAKTKDTGDDAELFIATLDGKTEQVTVNDIEDITPIYAGKDRIIWRELAAGKNLDQGDDMLPLSISEKKDGKWQTRALGINALTISVVGDDLFFVLMDEDAKQIKLMRCPIAQPDKQTDVTAVIKSKVNSLPATTAGR